MTMKGQKIIPYLWFDREAQEAAVFYTYAFKSGKIDRITQVGTSTLVEFDIGGFNFIGLNGGRVSTFTPSISFLASETLYINFAVSETSSGPSAGKPIIK